MHENVQVSVYNAHLHHNDFGIQDIGASQTFFFGGLVVSNRLCGADLYGGMRILHDMTVRGNSGGQVRIRTNELRGFGFEKTNPMLCTQDLLGTSLKHGVTLTVKRRCYKMLHDMN